MKIEKKPLVLHEFSGTWKEIGRQYGEDCRDEIKNMMGYWEKALHPIMPDKTMDEIIAATKVFEQPIRDYAPEIMEEIEGIAEGANISLGEALFHQGSFEMDVAGPLYIGGCTSFACSGKATKDGKTIAGQHFDWYDDADMILMRVKPNKGPAMLGTSIAGQVMQFGINSNGIGHYANVLAYPKSVVGVPAVVVAQKGLQSKNVPDVIRCITQAPNAIALNHMIAGKDGEMVDVEATPDKCGVLLPDCGCDILTHANNFLCHYLQESCMGGLTSFPDTYLRAPRLKQLMMDHFGELDVNLMMELMQDHRCYPDSICRHCDLTGPEFEQFCTLTSLISLPGEGKLWATNGCPCENPYYLYTL